MCVFIYYLIVYNLCVLCYIVNVPICYGYYYFPYASPLQTRGFILFVDVDLIAKIIICESIKHFKISCLCPLPYMHFGIVYMTLFFFKKKPF